MLHRFARIVLLVVAVMSSGSALPTSAAGQAIVALEASTPPTGTLIPGESATSSLMLRNLTQRDQEVFLGYSIRDPLGQWHDVTSVSVTLRGGDDAVVRAGTWTVPEDAVPGWYAVVIAVWDAPPEEQGARRLADLRRDHSFRVAPGRDPTNRLHTEEWVAGVHALGRGRFSAQNLTYSTDGATLRLPPGDHSGAEIRSVERFVHGTFTARLRTSYAPGSLSAFFLYEGVAGENDELDVEIFNDGSRKALVSAWRRGKLFRQREIVLPFDPAADLHDYTIERGPGGIAVLIDGERYVAWSDYRSDAPLHVIVNTWWPSWLQGPTLSEPGFLRIASMAW